VRGIDPVIRPPAHDMLARDVELVYRHVAIRGRVDRLAVVPRHGPSVCLPPARGGGGMPREHR